MRGFPKTIGTRKDLENLLAIPKFADQARAKLKEFEEETNKLVKTKTRLRKRFQQLTGGGTI